MSAAASGGQGELEEAQPKCQSDPLGLSFASSAVKDNRRWVQQNGVLTPLLDSDGKPIITK